MSSERLKEAGCVKKVVIVAMPGSMMLDYAGPADVFHMTNKVLAVSGGENGYNVEIVSPVQDMQVSNTTGLEIRCKKNVADITMPIDLLLIAGNSMQTMDADIYTGFYNWLQGVNENNTKRIASVCTGAFALAKAGLLNGRKATTHWEYSDQLKKRFPLVEVDPNAFYTSDGYIYTSGGVSSGIDLSLAIVEEDHGRDIALQVARKLVFYLKRPGFQVQFGNLLPAYDNSTLAEKLRDWLVEHLHEPLDVFRIAQQANMSVRNFSRVFHKQTGLSPAKFIEKLRIEIARKYLEDTSLSLEETAEKCGLGGLVSMRRTFLRHLMITPSDYRQSFRSSLQHYHGNPVTSAALI
jgi:transcriptional regulator GlxA family with amidase domain